MAENSVWLLMQQEGICVRVEKQLLTKDEMVLRTDINRQTYIWAYTMQINM